MSWQPTGSLNTLRQRAHTLQKLRTFFAERDCLEVDVPVLGHRGVTDPHIDCIAAHCGNDRLYLQSSPEYFMKRLLAAGSGDIYCLGKAFREGESGSRHNPEFTMLEWYRVGWDEHRLMDEVAELIEGVANTPVTVTRLSYRQAFALAYAVDPHMAPLAELQALAAEAAGMPEFTEDRSTCLDLLFSLRVEPALPAGLVLVYDYPACQAALAQLANDEQGTQVARRFEAFWDGMELANGYFELTSASEQQQRFEHDRQLRVQLGKPTMLADEQLLAALAAGFPECAGVALGVDRLLLKVTGESAIEKVMSFPLRSI